MSLIELAERAHRGSPEIEAMAEAIMRARRQYGWTFNKRERVMAIDLIMAEAAAAALRARAGGDGWQFVATISGRMCQIDSVSELLRLINGGARIESISAASPAGVSDNG